jgi:hypothetical protein
MQKFWDYCAPNTTAWAQGELRRLGSAGVVCDDSTDFVFVVEFHEFCGYCTFLVFVAEDDTGESEHDIEEFEMQIGEGFESELEVIAQGSLAHYGAGRIVQEFGCYWRCEDDVGGVMGHDGVKVVGVPGGDPIVCERSGFCSRKHSDYYTGQERRPDESGTPFFFSQPDCVSAWRRSRCACCRTNGRRM